MPWITEDFKILIRKAKALVVKEFKTSSTKLDIPIFIASKEELDQAVLQELQQLHYSNNAIKKIQKYFLPYIIGKYFKLTGEIWVIHRKGENVDTLVHELLHSIQKCEPNREGIVDYLTYRITGNTEYIDSFELLDWQEIEKTTSFFAIKKRLINEGDCEEF